MFKLGDLVYVKDYGERIFTIMEITQILTDKSDVNNIRIKVNHYNTHIVTMPDNLLRIKDLK
jgi:hypothetical protein